MVPSASANELLPGAVQDGPGEIFEIFQALKEAERWGNKMMRIVKPRENN